MPRIHEKKPTPPPYAFGRISTHGTKSYQTWWPYILLWNSWTMTQVEMWEMRWIKISISISLIGLSALIVSVICAWRVSSWSHLTRHHCWQGPTKGQSLLNLRYVLVGTLSLSGIWTWGQWIGNKQQFALRKSIFFLSQQSCELEMCECLFS